MRNRNFILVVLITLLTAFFIYTPVFAGTAEEEKLRKFFEGQNIPPAEIGEAARVVTNDELFPIVYKEYFQNVSDKYKPFRPDSFAAFFALAYGDRPYGTFDLGEYRYIGYTNKDEAFTNFWFRPDFVPGGGFNIHKARWIKNPLLSPLVSQFLTQMVEPQLEDNPFLPNNPFVGSKLRPAIVEGLKALAAVWPEYYKFDASASTIQDWENYVHILQPPSFYCFGTGRMFHQAGDGSIWYLDVPVPPGYMLELDLAAKLEKDKYEGKPGEKIDTTATFSLAPEYNFPVEAKLRLYIETEKDIIELPFVPVDPAKKLDGNKYTFQPGEKLTVKVSPTVPNEPAELVVEVDPMFEKGKTIVEADTDNNKDRAPFGSVKVNLVAVSIAPGVQGEAEPNFQCNGMAVFKNTSDKTLETVPIGVFHRGYRAVLKNHVGQETTYDNFAPGEEKAYSFSYTTPDAGTTWLTAVIDTPPLDNKYSESTESDNKITVQVKIRDVDLSKQGDRRLNLQAYSYPGEDLYGNWHESKPRFPFTAKWTDDVHATLTVDKPVPPRGWLDWWEISWARLSHPEQNPDFQFGDPLPPRGMTMKQMSVPGPGLEETKQATVVFEENWAMDGAQIYNMVRDELMAENPKNYPISVEFQVTYQYSYIVCDGGDPPSCWVVTETASYTDTATANLLVNGTGRAPYAN